MDDTEVTLATDLSANLATSWLGRPATVLAAVRSTQDEARRLARAGAGEGTLVWARQQTRGRGRVDRRWSSPPGAGLWFSVILRPRLAPATVAFLTILAGVAVAEALNRVVAGAVRLKWPNDLFVGEAKLGGILAEAETTGSAVDFVVLGIGVNLHRPPGGFDPAIVPPPADLTGAAATAVRPAETLAAILLELEARYDQLLAEGPAAAREAWLALSSTVGRDVEAQLGGGSVRGRAVDLAPDGSLVLETPDGGRLSVASGEVIHLR